MDLLFSPIVHPETPGVLLQQNLEEFIILYSEHNIFAKNAFFTAHAQISS